MANANLLADLRAGRCSTTAEVRLLRFWEARNINKKRQLMSLEMLFVDENVATFSPAVGSRVWVEDQDEAWLDGEVVDINGEQIKVLCTSGKQVTVNASNIYPKDVEAPASGVEDMTRLAYLHEPGVLQNLQSRYDINEIYVSYS